MSRVAFGFVALAMLSACGVRGDLDRPDPLWNSEDAIRMECERQIENNERVDPRCAEVIPGAAPTP
jgi:hypothetical protein